MDRDHVKASTNKTKGAIGKKAELKFDKPLGSTHNDEADLRDLARKAAKKSQ